MNGPIAVLKWSDRTALMLPGLKWYREQFQDAITGTVTCPRCGYSRPILYNHGPEGRGVKIHILRTNCPVCRETIEQECEIGKGFHRLTRQRLDELLRNATTLTAVLP